MNERKSKEVKSSSINLILVSISLIIFGAFGLIFITQMELLQGWVFNDYENTYPVSLNIIGVDNINDDDVKDIIAYADITHWDEDERIAFNEPTYGAVFALDGVSGEILWIKEYNDPVKNVFQIKDCNNDGYNDYLVSRATVKSDWDKYGDPEVKDNQFSNFIVSGKNGKEISLKTGESFTDFYIKDMVNLDDYSDNIEDIICLEYNYSVSTSEYELSANGYYKNGTLNNKYIIGDSDAGYQSNNKAPAIELFPYNDENYLLIFGTNNISLHNITSPNYNETEYNKQIYTDHIADFIITDDLNSDGIQEIITTTLNGNLKLIDGSNGEIIKSYKADGGSWGIFIQEVPKKDNDEEIYIIIDAPQEEDSIKTTLLSVKTSKISEIWSKERPTQSSSITIVLDDDLNGDDVNDLILHEEIETTISRNEVDRLYLVSAEDPEENLGVINIENSPEGVFIIPDINGDGINDIAFSNNEAILVMAVMKPLPIWLSPAFPLGIPLFILLSAFLCIGILILIMKGKTLNFSFKKGARENRLTFIMTTIAISVMTITFLMFLGLINVFNSTLVLGNQMTSIIVAFILVTIIWYGMLPLTAAIYNRLSVRFASAFIKIRTAFFKISKTNDHEIIVLDLGDRHELGTVNKVKRVILPLLLSIAIGFYSYNVLADIFQFAKNFTTFGSTDFFSFLVGYLILCVIPMIFSFIIFSFLISGNYLLDDAGIAYYLESRKYRKPGDIEPISIWAQSFIKGIAGFSALITFVTFLSNVDLSGFFGEDIMMSIFGVFIIGVFFWGLPFLTGFAFILFAIDIMELTREENVQKLYEVMEKNGYDTTPRKLINLYPSGYEPSEKMKSTKSIESIKGKEE